MHLHTDVNASKPLGRKRKISPARNRPGPDRLCDRHVRLPQLGDHALRRVPLRCRLSAPVLARKPHLRADHAQGADPPRQPPTPTQLHRLPEAEPSSRKGGCRRFRALLRPSSIGHASPAGSRPKTNRGRAPRRSGKPDCRSPRFLAFTSSATRRSTRGTRRVHGIEIPDARRPKALGEERDSALENAQPASRWSVASE